MLVSESMAAYSIDATQIEAPVLEATSATNHKLEFTGKAKVLVQIGDSVIVLITQYFSNNFFRQLLFGIHFMNESRSSLSYPANTLNIDGNSIRTKIDKIKPGMHSICDLMTLVPYVMPERSARTVPFDIPLNEEGDPQFNDGELVRVESNRHCNGSQNDGMVPHCITKVVDGYIMVPMMNHHDKEIRLPIDERIMRVERFNPDILSVRR